MNLYTLKFPYRKVLQPMAQRMESVDPDVLGYLATGIAAVTGVCYYFAMHSPWLLIVAVGLTFLRMTLNTIDGVIAINQKKDTMVGEIENALPDRYSDVFYLVGIAVSPLCNHTLGLAAICSVFLVSYTGMLGKAVGVDWQHQGPLGKVERLILVMGFSVVQYILLSRGTMQLDVLGVSMTALEWCMVLYVVLGQVTVYNRLRGQMDQIKKVEWEKKFKYAPLAGKVLVAYDSTTGNTAKVAYELGECFRAEVKRVQEVSNIGQYELVIIGTPNLRGRPSRPVMEFVNRNSGAIKQYAVFVTYGMPVWGPISTGNVFSYIRRAIGKNPVSSFSCKGYHAKYKQYSGHPTDTELSKAFLFGVRVGRKVVD